METSAEACWRLSKACGQWAVESRDSAVRIAFRQMATAWARLALNEEFIFPLDERIDPPPSSESSEPTPAEILTSSLLTPPSENAQAGSQARLDEPARETVLAAKRLSETVGQVAFTLETLADRARSAVRRAVRAARRQG